MAKEEIRIPRGTGPCYVPETAFGKWFLQTRTWVVYVLEYAIRDLERLIPQPRHNYPVVVDVGCGNGRSLSRLQERFRPDCLLGLDIDPVMLEVAGNTAKSEQAEARLVCCSSICLGLADNSVDLLFCHQTFHHLVDQNQAIKEFYRVLKPGGLLLFAESTRRYIHSWIIRLLFRHPMDVQKTADEYLHLIRGAGFEVDAESISFPYLWWSRSDLGILEKWFGVSPPADREETLINLIAVKPQA